MSCYIGLDIGGTKIMVKSIDTNTHQSILYKEPTPIDYLEGINLLHHLIKKAANGQKILGIGAAIGGPIDHKNHLVSPLHQPNWRDVPLKKIMENKWQCPFYVDVDTNVAAFAEYTLGDYQQGRFLYITLSTGMGGGFILDGKIYQGLSHPEIAHQCITHPYNTVICECGASNCLEALVSGNGIRNIYKKPAEELNTREWDEVAYHLALGLRNIACILSPEVIVFGGGVSIGGGNNLLNLSADYLNKELKLVSAPKLILSTLGYDTALEGAVLFAQAKHLH